MDSLKHAFINRGDARLAAVKYLAQRCEHLRAVEHVHIDCRQWPELKRIPATYKAPSWKVRIYASMFEQFMAFMYQAASLKKLQLCADQNFCLPFPFFKLNSTKELKVAIFNMKAMIFEDDFLDSNASPLRLTTDTISDKAINRKIRKWYDSQMDGGEFTISCGRGRALKKEYILIHLPYEEEQGVIKIRRGDGKVAEIRMYWHSIFFKVVD